MLARRPPARRVPSASARLTVPRARAMEPPSNEELLAPAPRWLRRLARAWRALCETCPAPPAPWLEEYEPRLLYSADFAPDALALTGETQLVEQRLLDLSEEAPAPLQASAQRVEILIIDPAVTVPPDLIGALNDGGARRIEVLTLDPSADAIDQISAVLAGRQDIAALHVVSHGSEGELQLGSTVLNLDVLERRGAEIAGWGDALTVGGDILLYGCNVAADPAGEILVQRLGMLTRAEVSASDDLTGNGALGGDWHLEYATGPIETRAPFTGAFQQAWQTVFANTPPTLGGANNLAPITEDDVSNSGTLVSALIAGMVTDPDAGALTGIAVTAVDNTNGTWQYSINGGAAWNNFGAPSVSNARVLAADAITYVRFVPDADFSGTVSNGLTFRAWDQTDGVAPGSTANSNSTTTDTVRDNFGSVSYSNNNGSDDWSTNWVDTDGNPASGNIQIVGGRLRLTATIGNTDTIYREVDLSGATGATLTFSYDNQFNVLDLLGSVSLQISSNGGASYATLATFSSASNTGTGTFSADISAHIADDTRIRFAIAGVSLLSSSVFVDNVEVSYVSTAYSSATASSDITVTAVNDAPVNTVPGAQATSEDTPLVFSGGNGNQIAIADVDAAAGLVRVSLSVTNGTLTLSGTGGLAFSTGDGAADTSMVFTGTLANINAALNGLAFSPTANASGAALLTLTTNDQGNTGAGGALNDSDSVSITVTAVNDAPVNTVPGAQATSEDTPLVFSGGNGNQIAIADVDAAAGLVRVSLSVTNGTLTLSGTGGLAFSTGDGAADTSMVFTGTLANINAALNGLAFSPTANASGAALLTLTTNDQGNTGAGGALNDSDSVSITVTAVNDAPVNTVPGAQATSEDTPLVFSGGNGNQIAIADVDAAAGLVRVSLSVTNGTLTLSGTGGLAFSTGDGAADTSMVFTGTLANINAALNGLAFSPTANASGAALLTLTTNDQGNTGAGGALNDSDSVSITVTAVNDAPVNTVPGAQATSEDTPLVFSGGNGNQIAIADVDAAAGLVRVSLSVTNGTLTLSGTGGLAFSTGDGAADTSMVFTGTLANINAALNGLAFSPTANASGAALLTLTTNDQGNTGAGGALNDSDSVSITVTAVNDAPVNTVPGVQGTDVDVPLVLSSANGNVISVSDVDLGGNTLEVTLVATNGTLTLAATTGLTFNAGDGSTDALMRFTATLTDINAALDGLTFVPTAAFTGVGSIQITSNDQGASGAGGAMTDTDTVSILVNSVNDAPVNTVPGAQATNEDTPLVFSGGTGNQIAVADPDAATSPVQVTLSVTNGTLSLSGSAGLTFSTGDGSADATMVFTGTLADINAALNDLSFSPTADLSGAALLTLTTGDQGNTGSGGAQSDADTVNITIVAVADTPAVTGTTTNEDTQSVGGLVITLNPADGAEVTHYKITGITGGTLYLNDGVTVIGNGTFITVAQGAGGLKFTPTPDSIASGNFLAQASTAANDSGLGGAVVSAVVSVNAVNDAPTVTLGGNQTLNEDAGAQVNAGFASAAPGGGADEAGQTFSYTVTNDNNALFSVPPTIDASGQLSYTLAPNASGTATVTVFVTDSGGTANGGNDTSLLQSFTLTVNPVNDAPVNTVPGAQATSEDTPLVFSGGNGNPVAAADIDAGAGVVRVTLGVSSGTLTLSGTAGLTFTTGDGSADTTMMFTGTLANINAALNGLSFSPTANASGAALLTLTTNDQGNTGAGGALNDSDSVSITVTAVNDAPVNTVPGAQATSEDTPLVFSGGNGNQIAIADVDAAAGLVRVSLSVTNGTLTLSGTGGLAFSTGDGAADTSMVFTGTLANINAALNGLSFAPDADFSGAALLTLTTGDQGNTGSGGAQSDADTVNISVNAVNDAPTVTLGGNQTLNEDAGAQVNAGFASAAPGGGADEAGQTFSYTVTNDNNALFSVPPTIDASGQLSYTLAPNASGTATVTVFVTDSGGTANGGNDTSLLQSFTLTVNPVNDAPVIGGTASGAIIEDATSPDLSVGGTLTISDADTGESSFVAQLAAGSYGTFTIDAAGNWSYTAANSQAAIQQLAAGAGLVETFTALSADGTSQNVVITIIGTDETTSVAPPTTPPGDMGDGSSDDDSTTDGPVTPGGSITPGGTTPPGDTPPTTPPIIKPVDSETPTGGGETSSEPTDTAVTTPPVLADTVESPQSRSAESRHSGITTAGFVLDRLDPSFAILAASDTPSGEFDGTALRNQSFLQELDRLRETSTAEAELTQRLIGSAAVVGVGFSIGYVVWLLRGGLLLTSVLSSLPAWRFVDPLPVLGRLTQEDSDDGEDDSLEAMVADDSTDTGDEHPAARRQQ